MMMPGLLVWAMLLGIAFGESPPAKDPTGLEGGTGGESGSNTEVANKTPHKEGIDWFDMKPITRKEMKEILRPRKDGDPGKKAHNRPREMKDIFNLAHFDNGLNFGFGKNAVPGYMRVPRSLDDPNGGRIYLGRAPDDQQPEGGIRFDIYPSPGSEKTINPGKKHHSHPHKGSENDINAPYKKDKHFIDNNQPEDNNQQSNHHKHRHHHASHLRKTDTYSSHEEENMEKKEKPIAHFYFLPHNNFP